MSKGNQGGTWSRAGVRTKDLLAVKSVYLSTWKEKSFISGTSELVNVVSTNSLHSLSVRQTEEKWTLNSKLRKRGLKCVGQVIGLECR